MNINKYILIVAIFLVIIGLSASVCNAAVVPTTKSLQWNYTVNGTLDYFYNRFGEAGWAPALSNPNISINYNIGITNADTGAPIACHSSVPVGTKLKLGFAPHKSDDIYWFGTGYSGDSPYGEWGQHYTSATPITTETKDFVTDEYGIGSTVQLCTGSFYAGTFSAYIPLVVTPPTIKISNTTGMSCDSQLTGNKTDGYFKTCTVTDAGTLNPHFNFGATTGQFYYRYFDSRTDCGAPCTPGPQGNNVPLDSGTDDVSQGPCAGLLNHTSQPFVLNVPAQTIGDSSSPCIITTYIPTDGGCNGDAIGSYTSSEPFPRGGSYCSAGSADPATPADPTSDTPSTWTCQSPNGGNSSETCAATRKRECGGCAPNFIDGACGSANGHIFASTDTSYGPYTQCFAGTSSNIKFVTIWNCLGSGTGHTDDNCTASKAWPADNGACGLANGIGVTSIPTGNLCSAGTATAITGEGPWNWTCEGKNGGATALCSAPIITTPPSCTVNSDCPSGENCIYSSCLPICNTNIFTPPYSSECPSGSECIVGYWMGEKYCAPICDSDSQCPSGKCVDGHCPAPCGSHSGRCEIGECNTTKGYCLPDECGSAATTYPPGSTTYSPYEMCASGKYWPGSYINPFPDQNHPTYYQAQRYTNSFFTGDVDDLTADASGNIWAGERGSNSIAKINPSNGILETYSLGTEKFEEVTADRFGNIWVLTPPTVVNGYTAPANVWLPSSPPPAPQPNNIPYLISVPTWVPGYVIDNLIKLRSDGSIIGTYNIGFIPLGDTSSVSNPDSIIIDASGNIWAAYYNSKTDLGAIAKISSSGNILGTHDFAKNPDGSRIFLASIAVDASGNIWGILSDHYGLDINNLNSVVKLNSNGNIIGTYYLGFRPRSIAADALGNIWVTCNSPYCWFYAQLNSSGNIIKTYNYEYSSTQYGYANEYGANGIKAFDASGNIWNIENYFLYSPAINKLSIDCKSSTKYWRCGDLDCNATLLCDSSPPTSPPSKCTPPPAARCGSAVIEYPVGSKVFPPYNLCFSSSEIATPISPATEITFPTVDTPANWVCKSTEGGADSPTCTATVKAGCYTVPVP